MRRMVIVCEDHEGTLRGEGCPYCRIEQLEAALREYTEAKTIIKREGYEARWDRELTEEEWKDLNLNPYAMLESTRI